ncbi:aldehyde dehydrogenase [Heterostelium album PN500]|uniref:Aldehyde dehydrogenase n=1 Tax=Heterostelium pallidum (strain ATCC 26659 / Pp 5 / PN500) TaxID=670386 RepID=D3BH28_HETP5|nr:aldehyde dehydrogenase [Heterostelium album PN500]EFA79412.1 aldehyde dehydrogenase [Heterostelium album PN500]|eukprot:XP_020431533.1 aldehyde dehydrogenase [Heterostelium album PN500]
MGVMADQLFLQPINPATTKPIKDIKIDTKTSLKQKFDKAYLFKNEWKYEKANIIIRFRDLLAERIDSLANDLTEETGKPITQSKNEIKAVIERINFFLFNFSSCLQERAVRVTDKFRETLSYEPLGVVGNISAWNYPYFIGLNVIVPALLTGNCVLYKPSEFSSITGINIHNLLMEAGLPESAFQVVLGKAVISQSLLSLPIDGLFFTGSYATGKSISETLAGRMIPVQLELGGKDAAYVHKDVEDLQSVIASLADGAMYNTGQSCCSVERIYVDEEIHDQFVEGLVKEISTYHMGFDPKSPSTYYGPLTRGQPQIEHLQRLIGNATRRGATVELGGNVVQNAPGYFFAPTVLANVNHQMDIQKEELFGPVVTVQSVSGGPTEAVALMNDTPFGLTGSVYSKSIEVADYVSDNSNTGTVYWNACDRVSPFLPWSGRGHSGIGSTLGIDGIFSFLKPKARHFISNQSKVLGEPFNSNIVPTEPINSKNVSKFIEETHEQTSSQ